MNKLNNLYTLEFKMGQNFIYIYIMKNKFNLIFIIGCEGTGHHLFENCQLTPKPYYVLHKLWIFRRKNYN